MKVYRMRGKAVYVENEEPVPQGVNGVVHYVHDVHFRDYLMLRRRVPRLCRIVCSS